jgi:autotransporter-associated beta strand protein
MKKLLLILFMLASIFGYSQTTYDWLSTAPDGNWRQGGFGARWNPGGLFDEPPSTSATRLRFNNNTFTTMTNNVGAGYVIGQLFFGSSATTSRTIGGNSINFFEFGATWPRIENQSTTLHTINFPFNASTNAGFNMELVASSGNIDFGGAINNNGRTIQIYGNNSAIDATNRSIRLGGVLSGSGILNISQFGTVKLNAAHTYTGETQIDNGELWVESSGSIATASNIFVGNGGQLGNVTKFFISNSTGGTTVSNAININSGNANTRFIGSLNSSGTNTFSGNILRSTTQPLNIEVLNSGGSLNVSGVINGSSAITKVGAGTLVLSNSGNTYSGGTVISEGTVSVSNAGNLGAVGGAITIGNGTTTGTLNITSTLARTALRVTDASSAGVINVATGQTFTLTNLNMVSGTNNATKIGKSGQGTLIVSGVGTYVGQTQVGDGTVIVSNNSGLGTNNTTTARGIDLGLNVGDVSQANNVSVLATSGITVPQSIYVALNTSSATRTIGLSGASGTATFNNEIFLDGSLTTSGTGTVVLSGRLTNTGGLITTATTTTLSNAANNFTGTTTIQSGSELRLNPSANATYSSQIVLNGGTLATTSITANRTFTSSSTLRLDASSTIALGTNVHTLTFANSSAVTWTGSTLTITGWTGTPGITGTASAGRIFIGAANTTLTAAQLDQITFQGFATGAVLKTTGELMPKGYITYYSKGSLAPDVLTNWSLTTDGTGASPSNFTTTAVFVIQNGHVMTTSAAWTLSGANTTLQILNGGSLVSTFAVTLPATGTFQIDNGGLYVHDNTGAWATTIFNGAEVFGNSSTIEINKTATTLPTNSTYGNLTFDLNTTTGQSVNFSGNLTTINGNFIVKNTQGFELRLANAGTTLNIVGNLEVHPNAIFTLKAGTNAGNQTVNVDSNISLIGGTFYFNGPNSTSGGNAFLVARGSSVTISENVIFTGGNLIGASGFYLNRNVEQTLTIAHPFSTGNVRNRFYVSTSNTNPINEVYNGVAAQTTIDGTGAAPGIGWAAWPTAGTSLKSFTINNSTGVTLSTNRVVNTFLGLTSGTITPGANSLTLAAGATFIGGSASSHVNGVLNRVYASTGAATFPVGKGGNYRPVTFEYTALTGTSTVAVNQIESALTGALPSDTNLNNSRTWDISQTGGSSIGYRVTLDPTGDNVTGTVVMLKRESGTTTSNAVTSPNFTNTSAFTTLTGTNNFTLGSTCTVTSNAGSNQSNCDATSFTLAANTPSFGTGAWTVSGPSSNLSQFSSLSSPTATFTPDGGSGVYTLTWTITNGNCNANSNVTITAGTLKTWNGSSWTPSAPTINDAAVISSNYNVATDINACSLTVNSSAVVTIPSGNDVTLGGSITVSSGSFTLENNANLIQTTTATNSGNIIVKRNSSALIRQDYTLWSSPVTGQGLYAFSPFTFGNRFYSYNTNTNFYSNSVGFSLTGLDPNGVNGTDSNNVQFATAKGYLIRMPWNHPTAATVWNGQFTGVPNNGDITYTMTNGGAGQRFNLVGNPYPSPISMTQFVSDNSANITGTLYFWRETNNNTSNNAYCTWAGGTFTSNGEAQVFNPNGIIRTGQGFFVEASGAATTLDFKNGQRSSDNANQFFRITNTVTDEVTEANRFWLNLTNASGAFSQMAAGYMSNATNGVDLYDGKNINTGDVLLNSIIENADYTIQGKALPFNPADVIPLSCKITTAGNYTIAIDHVDGLFTGGVQAIYLKDNLTGTAHNLQTGAYNFASAAGTFSNRFEIVFQTQLGVDNPTFTENSVIVYSQGNDFVVNTGTTMMSSVKVFDIRGRLLQEKKGINASQTTMGSGLANQVLLVQITSEDGVMVTKKVIR